MKLKKLDIIGFKSFFERASITFPSGICAVVGPNGCGKSNVVDALRWVMGEQSIKQLRGKDKEDILFSGANGKPPLNMAEVSLTLVNDNGCMPEAYREFSEVMVTRRLYRSGESSFLINKHPCRLKDIHNIFMGSGVGARTYAVIQQGNIGAITDAGPDERRVFVEEAAGVTRYKMRKTEALRKVDATNQNLLRVTDIVTEIERRMNGLKRQARKAERFKRLKAEARRIDIGLIRHQAAELTRQMDQAKGRLRSLQDAEIGQRTELEAIDAAVAAIKLQRSEKDHAIATRKSRKFEIQRDLDRMEAERIHLQADRERLADEVRQLQGAHTELADKNSALVAEIDRVHGEHAALEGQVGQIKASIDRENTDSSGLRERIDTLGRTLEAGKNDLMTLVAEEARARNSHQNVTTNRENLKRRLKRTDEETLLADRTVKETVGRREAAAAELARLKNDIDDLNDRVAAAKTAQESGVARLSTQVKNTQILEMERNKARSSLATMKKMEANLDGYKDGVKAVLRAAGGQAPPSESRPLAGIVGLLADAIEPEPAYETAVAAALGETLQYILIQDQPCGADAIAFLRRAQAGRCGFIPVDALRGVAEHASHRPPAAGRILNHVRVKEGFAAVAEALLGHVTVADTLDEARETADRNGCVQTVVTRGGDIVSHQGMLIGGSPDKLSGILARKQEIRALTARCEQLDTQAAAAGRTQAQMEVQVRDLERDLRETIAARGEAEQEALEAEKELYRAEADLKNARRHLEIVRLEQDQLMGEELDLDDEIERFHGLLATIAGKTDEAQAQVVRTSAEIEATNAALEAFNQRIVDLNLKLTSAGANLGNSADTLRRLQDFQADGLRRLEQLCQDVAAKTEKIQGIETRHHRIGQTLADRYDRLKEMESRLDADEKAFVEIEAQLQARDRQVARIQTEREQLQRKIGILEMDLAEKRITHAHLENRSQEYYHCAIADLKPVAGEDPAHSPSDGDDDGDIDPQPDRNTDPNPEQMEKRLAAIRQKIAAVGDVNLEAIGEFKEQKARYDFLCEQRDDLVNAIAGLHQVIRKINRITQERFLETFARINEKLAEVFPRLFEGGSARLELTHPNEPLETGVEFMVHPPGKKLTRMSLLSGGEKALAAISFIFSIFLLKPASFCLMDEIDAPLDDANVTRFNNLMKVIGQQSQIIMVTHNKNTMGFAETLFGITMEQKGLSKVVSVNLDRHNRSQALTAA